MCRPEIRPALCGRVSVTAPDVLSASLAGNVGVCGSLADGYPDSKTLGGKPPLVAVSGRDWGGVSSSCGVYGARNDRSLGDVTLRAAAHPVGNSVGATGE